MAISKVADLGTITQSSSATYVITLTAGVAVGDAVIIQYVAHNNVQPTSCVDTAGNTYTKSGAIANGTSNNCGIYSTRVSSALSTGNTITITFPSARFGGASAESWTGVVSSGSIIDQVASATGSAAAWSVGPTAAQSQNNNLAYAIIGHTNPRTNTPGGSYIALTQDPASSVTTIRTLRHQYRIMTGSAAAETATGTLSGTSTETMSLVTFKEQVASGVTVTPSAATFKVRGVRPIAVGDNDLYNSVIIGEASLKGHWPLSETVGNFVDSAVLSNATVTGTPTRNQASLTTDSAGRSVSNWTTANYAQVADNARYSPATTTELTVGGWFLLPTAEKDGTAHIIMAKAASVSWEWTLHVLSDGNLTFIAYNNSGTNNAVLQTTGLDVYDNTPHHIMATYDEGVEAVLYLDGNQVARTTTFASTTADSAEPVWFGRRGDTAATFRGGRLQELQVYSAKLSYDRIRYHYESSFNKPIFITPAARTVRIRSTNPTVVTPPVVITPTAATVRVRTAVQPTVVLGSLVLSPAARTVRLRVVTQPTAIAGSITIVPTARSVRVRVVTQPTVVQSSMVVVPTARTVRLRHSGTHTVVQSSLTIVPTSRTVRFQVLSQPTPIAGSITLTPAIRTVRLRHSGTHAVVQSSMVVAPATRTVRLRVVTQPTPIAGSITIAPTARTVRIRKTDPIIVLGSMTITGGQRVVRFGRTNPSVVQSSVVVSPTARDLSFITTSPAITLGSVIVDNQKAAVRLRVATQPDVQSGSSISVSPTAASLSLVTAAPTVVNGQSISVTPNVISFRVRVTTQPSSILGSIAMSPAARVVRVRSTDPTTVYGSVTVIPLKASFRLRAADPDVLMPGPSLVPAARTVRFDTTAPTVVLGSITVSGPTLRARTGLWTFGPSVSLGSVVIAPAAASLKLKTTNPSILSSGVTVTPSARTVRIRVITQPTVVRGNITVTPTTRVVRLRTLGPTVINPEGITLTPAAASLRFQAIQPTAIQGSLVLTPTARTLRLRSANPTVVLASIVVSAAARHVRLSRTNPVVVRGSVQVTPISGSVVLTTVSPEVTLIGDVLAQPAPAFLSLSTKIGLINVGILVLEASPDRTYIVNYQARQHITSDGERRYGVEQTHRRHNVDEQMRVTVLPIGTPRRYNIDDD